MRWEKLPVHNGGTVPQGPQRQYESEEGSEELNGRPGKRWGHTCNSVKGGRFLYVFGGYGQDNRQTNKVHVYDNLRQTWTQPTISGAPPTPRDSHSCTTVGDNLYVFGGTDGLNHLQDLHILDTTTNTWISPSVRGDAPEAREGHSAALVGKRIFIFGGCGKSMVTNEEFYCNDVHVFNTETLVWKRVNTTGIQPSARDSHTCSSWKNKIIVVAGEDMNDYYLSDVHVLDTDTLVWKELTTSGQKLPPRAGHSTVAIGKNLIVFGGFTDAQNLYDDVHMLDLETAIWTKLIVTGQNPSARFSVSGDCLDPFKPGVIMFLGGCNRTLEALDDMYYLHTGFTSVPDENRLEKLSLKKQLKLKCQEQLVSSYDKSFSRVDSSSQYPHTFPQAVGEKIHANQWHLYQEKKTFQAKVTETFPSAYSIETFIEGKPLRGILFANGIMQAPVVNFTSPRKRAIAEVDGFIPNGDSNNNSKISRTKENLADHKRVDHADERKSATHPPPSGETGSTCLGVQHFLSPNLISAQIPDHSNASPMVPTLDLNNDMSPMDRLELETTDNSSQQPYQEQQQT